MTGLPLPRAGRGRSERPNGGREDPAPFDGSGDLLGLAARGTQLAGLRVEADEPETGGGLGAWRASGAALIVENSQMTDEGV